MASVILIPAYKPDTKMLTLLQALISMPFEAIVLIDDGSGKEFDFLFTQALAISPTIHMVRHAVNLGKGAALKTGINACLNLFPNSNILTADCDGQHTPKDILSVSQAMETYPNELIIGGRAFKNKVPARSMVGNTIMRVAFSLSTGIKIHDTQTGLRGLPLEIAKKCLTLPGNRYEYEMNMLLKIPTWGYAIREIPIETIYIEDNASSHFHPIRDAIRVFSRLFLYAGAAIASFIVDYVLYGLISGPLQCSLALAFILARCVSSVINFLLNRSVVFQSHENIFKQAVSYFALVIFVMLLGSLAVTWLSEFGLNRYVSKILTDIVLFVMNYFIQRNFVFKTNVKKKG